jgi:hypothetical protein
MFEALQTQTYPSPPRSVRVLRRAQIYLFDMWPQVETKVRPDEALESKTHRCDISLVLNTVYITYFSENAK